MATKKTTKKTVKKATKTTKKSAAKAVKRIKKLTREQLSRIMSEHEGGNLTRRGWTGALDSNTCCIMQAAAASTGDDWIDLNDDLRIDYKTFFESNPAGWFDVNYDKNWSVEEFLAKLEEKGWA